MSPDGLADLLELTMSSQDAAKELGVTQGQINTYCRTGRLRAFKMHHNWFVYKDSVRAFKEAKRIIDTSDD